MRLNINEKRKYKMYLRKKLLVFFFVISFKNLSFAQSASDIPITITSPVVGSINYLYPPSSCTSTNAVWGFCQHQSGLHSTSGGVGGANDYYAWDCNLGGSNNYDAGKEVYPVEDGYISNLSNWTGNSVGQLLIRHVTNGKTWYSGYLHMSNITSKKAIPGTFVSKNEIIGNISSIGATNDHLHFAVYYYSSSNQLVSVNRTFLERTDCIATIPQLITPTFGQSNTGIPVYFDWEDVAGPSPEYRIQVSTTNSGWTPQNGFSSSTSESATIRVNRNTGSISNLSWALTDAYPPAGFTTYYYTIKSYVCGQSSEYSPVRSFTTTCVPVTPLLSSPATGATNVLAPVNFDWNDISATSPVYRIQVSTSNTGWTPENGFTTATTESSTLRVNQNTGSSSSYSWSASSSFPPQPGIIYYWTVKANACNINTAYSPVRSFSVAAATSLPGSFSLTATPECNGTNSQVRLSWTASSNSTSYDLFRNGALIVTNLTTTQYVNTGLTAGSQYIYYVQAKNSSGTTSNSDGPLTVNALNCTPILPGSFTLTATPQCSGNLSQVLLNWTASSNATSYDVYRNSSLLASNITSLQYLNTGLTGGVVYSYYVQAKNAVGVTNNQNGALSSTSLNCSTPLPGSFSLTATPECNGTNSQVRLSWTASSNSISYDLFRNGALIVTNLTSTQYTNTGLTGGAQYIYYVQAKNSSGTTSNSNGPLNLNALNCTSGLPGAFTLSVTAECNFNLSQIKVSWTPSANATTYDIYRNGVIYMPDVVSTQLNNTGVTPGITYSYLIKAKNQFGTTDNQNGTLSAIAPNCNTTSILDPQNPNSPIHIYPNPADQVLLLSDLSITKKYSYSIIDYTGRHLLKGKVQNTVNHQINTNNLPAGTYMLQLYDAKQNKLLGTEKIIIVH